MTTHAVDPRELRTALAVAGEAWAYLAAEARRDSTRARGALMQFQRDFTARRASVIAVWPPDRRGAVDQLAPRSLRIDGIYGPNSRMAMAVVLSTISSDFAGLGLQRAMPTRTRDIPSWFATVQAIPRADGPLVEADRRVRTGRASDAQVILAAWSAEYIASYQPSATATQVVQTAQTPVQRILQETAPEARAAMQEAGVEPDSAPDAEVSGPTFLVRGRTAPRVPAWGYALAAAAAVGLAGVFVYQWKVNR